MRVIIAGSRDIFNSDYVKEAIKESGFDITEVVCGGASGIDALGKDWAERNKVPVKVFEADWKKEGSHAGPIRNKKMADYATAAGALILVWDGMSSGSKSMLGIAKNVGMKVFEKVV